MYYLLRGFFLLFSLLPYPVIYLISDGVYFLLYRVFRYRKEVVMENLRRSLPGKSEAEINRIASQFYRNFCDTWMETIKIFTITKKEAARRIATDFSLLEKYYAEGKSVQLYSGHFMNWEYVTVCVPLFQPFTFLGIYMPLTNPAMERLFRVLRSRFGVVLLKAGNVKTDMKHWVDKQYLMGLGADQSPSNLNAAFWLYYMHQPTAFIRGPWERACRINQPTVFLKITKIKRGYYTYRVVPFEEDPSTSTPEKMVRKFADMLEECIQESPELYLWSHKRWKKPWKPEYIDQWVDSANPPPSA
jgi:Kdo2-lipid IVA lauroyltransferase/acyltransferase